MYYIFTLRIQIHCSYCMAVTEYSFSFYNFLILFLFIISQFFISAFQRNKKINILLKSQRLIFSLHYCLPSTSSYDITSGTSLLLLKNKTKHKGLLHPNSLRSSFKIVCIQRKGLCGDSMESRQYFSFLHCDPPKVFTVIQLAIFLKHIETELPNMTVNNTLFMLTEELTAVSGY